MAGGQFDYSGIDTTALCCISSRMAIDVSSQMKAEVSVAQPALPFSGVNSFVVNDPGSTTYYLVCETDTGIATVFLSQIVAMFFTTLY